MEAIGSEVLFVISVPLIALSALITYYWQPIYHYLKAQFTTEVRI